MDGTIDELKAFIKKYIKPNKKNEIDGAVMQTVLIKTVDDLHTTDLTGTVRYDIVQSLTDTQKQQARDNISVLGKDYVDTKISTEETARQNADALLQTNIDTEKTAREAADVTLNDRIDNISIGRFLSTWNMQTGKPTTNPSTLPYTYKSGDYYIVSNTGQYKPSGNQYTGSASTVVETATVNINDIYRYDGTAWVLLSVEQKSVAWGQIGGTLSDQTDLYTALQQLDKIVAVQYGDTSFVTGYNALQNNKLLVAFKNNQIYHCVSHSTAKILFSVIEHQGLETLTWESNGVWSSDAIVLEDTQNKVTSITSTSTDVQYPSAKAVYNMNKLFIATYKVTTLDEITAAVNEGKICVVKDGTKYALMHSYGPTVALFEYTSGPTNITYMLRESWVKAGNANYEIVSNKVTSISSSSTDTQYPSAKCVYDAIQGIGGGGTFIATYASTTFTEIQTAVNAGKIVKCENGQYSYDLQQITTTAAIFSNNIGTVTCTTSGWTSGTYAFESKSNKVTSISSTSTDTEYPSAKCVYDAIQGGSTVAFADITGQPTDNTNLATALASKQSTLTSTQLNAVNSGITASKVSTFEGYSTSKEDKSNKVDTISSSSTNVQYPSALAVYTALENNKGVFIATYDTTTYDEITTALNAGKVVYAIYSGAYYWLSNASGTYQFLKLDTPNSNYPTCTLRTVACSTAGTWTNSTTELVKTKYINGYFESTVFETGITPFYNTQDYAYLFIDATSATTAATLDFTTGAFNNRAEYDVQIRVGSNVPSVVWPSTIKWNSTPTLAANTCTEVNIVNNIGYTLNTAL